MPPPVATTLSPAITTEDILVRKNLDGMVLGSSIAAAAPTCQVSCEGNQSWDRWAPALPSIIGIVGLITGAVILQEHDISCVSMTIGHLESSAYSQQDATVVVAPTILVHVPYLSRHGLLFVRVGSACRQSVGSPDTTKDVRVPLSGFRAGS